MVCGTHGDDGADGHISGVSIGVDIHKDQRLSGELEIIREGGGRSSDTEAGGGAFDTDILLGVGGDGAGILLEVLRICGRRWVWEEWKWDEEKCQGAAGGGSEGLAVAFPGLDFPRWGL